MPTTQRRLSRKTAYEAIQGYLWTHPCSQCGFSDIRALDFHHRNPAEKVMGVATMANRGMTIGDIFLEIEKCDILCANCHRVYHAEQRGIALLAP